MRVVGPWWRLHNIIHPSIISPRISLGKSPSISAIYSMSSARSLSTVVGVVQMTSTPDKEHNWCQAQGFIEKAVQRGAKMVFLPECFDYVSENQQQAVEQSETIEGTTISQYRQLAERLGVWLSLGGFHQRPANFSEDQRVLNTHIVIDSSGSIKATYSKAHLFNVDIKGGLRLQETDFTIPGDKITPPVDTPMGKLGLSICYDLRFPELSTALTQQGAEILTYPSAFTVPTGMAHWEVLLRSRAIENQAYVIAAAQVGQHTAKRTSYGHSMIIDPWGTVLAECAAQPGVCVAEIDLGYLQRRRTEMPLPQHRRHDLYGHITTHAHGDIFSQETYLFGPHTIPASCVFYKTPLSLAFVNKKPVLQGHVLVSPLRVVEKLGELTAAEVADMFTCAQRVASVIRQHYSGTAATLAIQDGKEAGQTVKHVHIHILPRKPGDFQQNDDIYDKLEKHDAAGSNRKWRTDDDMAAEAATLRPLFLTCCS